MVPVSPSDAVAETLDTNYDEILVTITVTDVNEGPSVSGGASANFREER